MLANLARTAARRATSVNVAARAPLVQAGRLTLTARALSTDVMEKSFDAIAGLSPEQKQVRPAGLVGHIPVAVR